MHQGYDLIGDVHGCGKTLVRLLEQMGYSKRNGVYQHAKRKVIFLGDIVDRGPNIRLACQVVRDMVEQGHAYMVMGNHEYNLITYCTETPKTLGLDRPYLRSHTERNAFIVEQSLEQYANHKAEFNELLDWFLDIPLFMEFPDFRVVHACWDQTMIAEYISRYGGNQMTRDLLLESVYTDSFIYQFLDRMLRGTTLELPNGRTMTSRDGMVRRFFRAKFWKEDPQTYQDVVFQPDPLPEDLRSSVLTDDEKSQLLYYSPAEKPLFIGHYWMWGVPAPIHPNIACLDYSAVKYGRLVAYRMDTECQLQSHKFTWIPVEKSERS